MTGRLVAFVPWTQVLRFIAGHPGFLVVDLCPRHHGAWSVLMEWRPGGSP